MKDELGMASSAPEFLGRSKEGVGNMDITPQPHLVKLNTWSWSAGLLNHKLLEGTNILFAVASPLGFVLQWL